MAHIVEYLILEILIIYDDGILIKRVIFRVVVGRGRL